jgi:hypothetical protein
MSKHDVKNKPQHNGQLKTNQKNKQELAAAYIAHQPNAQQSEAFYPQGNRYIRSWAEASPDQEK